MAEPIPLPVNPPRTHSRLYHHPALRTGGRRRTGWFERRGRWIAHHFRCCLRRRESCILGATFSQPTLPLRELPPARLVIHRQTSAHERREETRNVQSRSGMLAHLCTRQHWLWVTVEPHISGTRHDEAVAREGGRYPPVRRVLGSQPLSLRTHRHRGRLRPLRSAVVEKQAPSVAVWLQLCARTGHASGLSRHPFMHGSPPAHGTPRPCLRTAGLSWHGTLYPQGAMTS